MNAGDLVVADGDGVTIVPRSQASDVLVAYQALKDNKILSAENMERLTRPYIAETPDESSHYAYGWAIFRSARDTKIVSHNGGNGIFFHDFLWLPEEDVVILFSTNGVRPGLELAWRIERMMFDPSYQPKPVGPNAYATIFDHIQNHQPATSGELFERIQRDKLVRSPRTLNEIGYFLLEEKPHWAVAVFGMNTQLYPDVSNVWDSLGEGYLKTDQRNKAIDSYKKAAEMGNQNAVRMLKELGDKAE